MQTKAQLESRSTSATRNEDLKCWGTRENPLCLKIELADGTQFILPYGYFEGAKFVCDGDTEFVHLEFKAHQIVIKGNALTELFDALQSLSVEWLKECPRRYQALQQKGQAVIASIEVKNSEG